ncbi:aryl-alcohol dehydrogenase-like predicted oxidoreductase [Deinobacterium chartae]|uniref:Aryl-alcohol dehydrogenase-like predicted oxidoreductase n=1 Tax=Deinobacterium chartae TaxID=521158 RepID=A0A841I415_9DEIO|nr:aldo/keto reductase [Deinobacterium chartae]MBB6099049.1 aryl-alcohol dehydrogenase-like predicted oxidoreductase [Deinobacterium chartae]
MNYRLLGRSGIRVSEVCLGTMTFGREADEAESVRMLERFLEAGGNFVDTANNYASGHSEEILGRWLQTQPREAWVIATKVRWPVGRGPNDEGLSRRHILQQAERSLRRLNCEYIDLYQLHGWDSATDLEETFSALETLVQRGWVRSVGVSNFSGWQLQKTLDLCVRYGWPRPVSLQPQYNLLSRQTEWELLEVCRLEGLAVLPWSPLKSGWLSGRFRRGMKAPPQGSRIESVTARGGSESWDHLNTERTWRVLDALHAVAERSGRPAAQVALRWLMQRPGVTAPVLGARSLEQLDPLLEALTWQLSPEDQAELTRASELPLPHPYDLLYMERGWRLQD